jgi:hypothetical protein
MDLVFVHGPVGVGKLTVARELARLTGYRLFHNHLVVDALLAVFEFGSAPFVRLREQIWLDTFREAAQHRTSLIFTFAPERTVGESFVGDAIRAVESHGGRVRFVALVCDPDVLEQRIVSASRAGTGKLTSIDAVRKLREAGAFAYPKLPDSGLTIDTGRLQPAEAAAMACRVLGLRAGSDA